ncbi:MAG: crossover junction endodeoxyribonuclease RuvC [candidate division Zixibacteria bacterium]|nr:crossover junction endodeoxyribonuclease RuvC [candidate division Zixibacteria bacterium]
MTNSNLIILGIDPGSTVTGYGIIKENQQKTTLVEYGVIKVSPRKPLPERLQDIFSGLNDIIEKIKPHQIAVEKAFYSKNAKSALVMGEIRGIALLSGAQAKIPLAEYSPREIKFSIVGTGAASKAQVQYMVKNILNLRTLPEPEDASDALAIALCHLGKLKTKKRLKSLETKS